MLKLFLLSLPLIFLPRFSSAQDYHMSQYDMLPLYYNPAQTGVYFGAEDTKYRFCGTYRSQWQKLQGKPYSSIDVGYDMTLKRYGVGVIMMDHIAGTSNFATFQFLASGAYRITSDDSKKHFLAVGVQMGLFQKRFSYNYLLFENQYTTTDGLDPNLSNGEDFADLSIIRFDANVGLYYKFLDPNRRFDPSAGFSIYHVTMPNESFTGQKSRLPMRFNGILNCDIHANDYLTFTPNILFMYQREAVEFNAGVLAGYALQNSPYQLLGGLSYRYRDAMVIHLGMKQGPNVFRISYDIVTSPLKKYGGSRGGFEMGVIYSGGLKGGRQVRAGGI
ncbi:MAG TPA: PorP/SprF family type IX secretion system membrane protein [Bacteroidia bacterium]|nr:PorP/SprF family type IX secretion system membrane protein [Bacteroidia bacterium]